MIHNDRFLQHLNGLPPSIEAFQEAQGWSDQWQLEPEQALSRLLQDYAVVYQRFDTPGATPGLQSALETLQYVVSGLATLFAVEENSTWEALTYAHLWVNSKFRNLELGLFMRDGLECSLYRSRLLTAWVTQMTQMGEGVMAGKAAVWAATNYFLERLVLLQEGEAQALLHNFCEVLRTEVSERLTGSDNHRLILPCSERDLDEWIPLVTGMEPLESGRLRLLTTEKPYDVGPDDCEFPNVLPFEQDQVLVVVPCGEDEQMLLRISVEASHRLRRRLGISEPDMDSRFRDN